MKRFKVIAEWKGGGRLEYDVKADNRYEAGQKAARLLGINNPFEYAETIKSIEEIKETIEI